MDDDSMAGSINSEGQSARGATQMVELAVAVPPRDCLLGWKGTYYRAVNCRTIGYLDGCDNCNVSPGLLSCSIDYFFDDRIWRDASAADRLSDLEQTSNSSAELKRSSFYRTRSCFSNREGTVDVGPKAPQKEPGVITEAIVNCDGLLPLASAKALYSSTV